MGDKCAYLYQNLKFLCLTLCQGEVFTDDDTNDDDGQFMIV